MNIEKLLTVKVKSAKIKLRLQFNISIRTHLLVECTLFALHKYVWIYLFKLVLQLSDEGTLQVSFIVG